MCPSVCSSGRRSGGWERFQSREAVQAVNINRSVVEVNPGCHRRAVEIQAGVPQAGAGSPQSTGHPALGLLMELLPSACSR